MGTKMREKAKKICQQTTRLMKHFKRSVQISWQASRSLFVMRIGYELISVALPIVSLFLSRSVINILSTASYGNRKHDFYMYIAFVVLLQFFSTLLGRLNGYISVLHNEYISNKISMEIVDQVNKLDISYFDNPTFHDEMQNAIRDSGTLQSLTWISLNFIRSIVQLISHLLIMIRLNVYLPILIVISTIPSVFCDKYVAKRQYEWQLQRARNDRKLGYVKGILQSKGMAKDIRVFGVQEYFRNKYIDMWKLWFVEKRKMERMKLAIVVSTSLLPIFATSSALILVGNGILNNYFTVGDYSLYGGAASQLLSSIIAFTGIINQSYESEMRLSRYADFLKMEPIVKLTGSRPLDEINTIEFKNVCFTYPNTEKAVLKNISFKISRDQSLALVGLNGAGKSTIVKLILRLYDPESGEILINGINLKEYDIMSYYKCIGAVFQDFNRYDLRIRETIALTDIDGINDEERIRKACAEANLNIEINDLANGIDTYLGKTFDPDGIELSGGNWQKIAIAQAFFKKSSLMLFDEPNAALDPEAERNLFEKMVQLGNDKCVVYVTHRLSSATTADQILVINNGECCEMGTHSDLIKKKGKYYDLFNKQAEFYRDKK